MSKTDEDIAIKVSHVYKSFNIYYDRANTLKERMLFFKRNKRRYKFGNKKRGDSSTNWCKW